MTLSAILPSKVLRKAPPNRCNHFIRPITEHNLDPRPNSKRFVQHPLEKYRMLCPPTSACVVLSPLAQQRHQGKLTLVPPQPIPNIHTHELSPPQRLRESPHCVLRVLRIDIDDHDFEAGFFGLRNAALEECFGFCGDVGAEVSGGVGVLGGEFSKAGGEDEFGGMRHDQEVGSAAIVVAAVEAYEMSLSTVW